MRTDLATIDRHFVEATERQYDDPVATKADYARANKVASKTIAGFDVVDEGAREKLLADARAENKKTVGLYRQNRKKLINKLADLGVTALASLPTPAWRSICRQSGLFIIDTPSGQVVLSMTEAFKPLIAAAAGNNKKQVTWQVRNYLDTTPWEDVLTGFSDNGVFSNRPRQGYTADTKIVLPEAPADVQSILIKVSELNPKTAAVSDAIGFTDPLDKMIASRWGQVIEAERIAALRRAADPIVFVEEADVTAIVAQFGDFPIEQEIVEKVAAADIEPTVTMTVSKGAGGGSFVAYQDDSMAQMMMAQAMAQSHTIRDQLGRVVGIGIGSGGVGGGAAGQVFTSTNTVTNSGAWASLFAGR